MNRFEKFCALTFRKFPPGVLTIIVVVAIAYLTLARFEIDQDEIPPIPHLDKAVHFIMFGGLCWVLAMDYACHLKDATLRRVRPAFVAVVTALFSSLAGAAVEVAQGAMHNGRSEDWMDWVADTAGAIVGAIIAFVMLRALISQSRP